MNVFCEATLYDGGVQRTSFKGMNCSIAQCLEVVGDWWSLLIVRDAFRGITRFADLEADLGISRNVLNQRLAYLVEQGVVARIPYSEHPPRYDYQLTEKGRDLFAVTTAMRQWGDRWAAPNGPPIEAVHDGCGEVTQAILTCSVCGERLTPDSVQPVVGPGARPKRRRGRSVARAPGSAGRRPDEVRR